MKNVFSAIVFFALTTVISGCGLTSERIRMDQFGLTFDTYETAMRTSHFSAVCGLVNPEVMSRQECLNRFGDIKIVEYRLTHLNIPEDRMRVEQEVAVQYYRANTIVLKNNNYAQVWIYQEDTNKWLLQDGPPAF